MVLIACLVRWLLNTENAVWILLGRDLNCEVVTKCSSTEYYHRYENRNRLNMKTGREMGET